MSDALRQAVEELRRQLKVKLDEAVNLKITINTLAKQMGEAPPYAVEDMDADSSGGKTINPDAYFGMSPITAARTFLEMHAKPATPEAILKALEQGGFNFKDTGWAERDRLRSLAISLGKNTAIFVRLPSGPFGLTKWYPDLKKKKEKAEAVQPETWADKKESEEKK